MNGYPHLTELPMCPSSLGQLPQNLAHTRGKFVPDPSALSSTISVPILLSISYVILDVKYLTSLSLTSLGLLGIWDVCVYKLSRTILSI